MLRFDHNSKLHKDLQICRKQETLRKNYIGTCITSSIILYTYQSKDTGLLGPVRPPRHQLSWNKSDFICDTRT